VLGRIAAGAGSLGNDPRLSRRHAKVSRSNGRLLVEDLGSTGGTFVNGIAISRPTQAAPGDSIDLGTTTLRVLAPSASALADTRASVGLQQNSGAAGDIGIEVISGPAAGNQIPVGFEPFVLGRAEAGTGKLGNDPELSRRHASISYFDTGRLVVEDLDSTNGTFVNEHRIFMPTILKPGDAIRLGTSTLRVVDSGQSTGGR
jgi:pSer/pThr/pTyr-binding forkhead associated (FHA) protein